jgi:hypothetical protein
VSVFLVRENLKDLRENKKHIIRTTDVADIQDKAIEMQFTKHGEMFSAKNMAKLAKTVYKCDAKKVKGSHGILNDKKSLLKVIAGKFRFSHQCDFFNFKHTRSIEIEIQFSKIWKIIKDRCIILKKVMESDKKSLLKVIA